MASGGDGRSQLRWELIVGEPVPFRFRSSARTRRSLSVFGAIASARGFSEPRPQLGSCPRLPVGPGGLGVLPGLTRPLPAEKRLEAGGFSSAAEMAKD